jgi:hypothetical protein
MPTKANRWSWRTRGIVRDVAGELLDEKWSVGHEEGMDGRPRDVMSLLGELYVFLAGKCARDLSMCVPVKANSNEDARSKLTRGEVIDQMG